MFTCEGRYYQYAPLLSMASICFLLFELIKYIYVGSGEYILNELFCIKFDEKKYCFFVVVLKM